MAEASALDSTDGTQDGKDEHEVRLNLTRMQAGLLTQALGLARTDCYMPCKGRSRCKEERGRVGEKSNNWIIFWHFNIKTMTSGNNSKAKK